MSRIYGQGSNATSAAAGYTLDVDAGEFVAIVGPSGAGKSTLLNIIGLLDRPSAGSYRLDGVDVGKASERGRDRFRSRIFGFVFQDAHVLSRETVARNAALALSVNGVRQTVRESRVSDLLHRFGLGSRANALAGSLSGGERQRLAIARAISANPQILLADEPTGNLDTANADEVINILRSLNEEGMTVIVVTHDERVAAVADRRVRVLDGRIVEDSGSVKRTPSRIPALRASEGELPTSPRSWGAASDALFSLMSRPGRAVVLLLAFTIGAGGAAMAIDLSQSAGRQIDHRLNQAALDQVTVHPPASWDIATIDQAAADALHLEGVNSVGVDIPIAPKDARVSLLPNGASPMFGGTIEGQSTSLARMRGLSVLPDSAVGHLNDQSPAAILGVGAARDLGVSSVGPGSEIWVGGTRVPVIGLVTSSTSGPQVDDMVILTKVFAASVHRNDITIVFDTKPGYPASLADAIPLQLAPANPGSITVDTVADLRSLSADVNADFSVFILAISLAILALACFTAGTTMYTNVLSRTAEIALRRAVGAGKASIARIFLVEGAILGGAGGLTGMSLATAGTVVFCLIVGWTPVLSWEASVLAVGAGITTGVAAAVLPAILATRVDPAQAIRA